MDYSVSDNYLLTLINAKILMTGADSETISTNAVSISGSIFLTRPFYTTIVSFSICITIKDLNGNSVSMTLDISNPNYGTGGGTTPPTRPGEPSLW